MRNSSEYNYGDPSTTLWKIRAKKPNGLVCWSIIYRGKDEAAARERFENSPFEKGYEITDIEPFSLAENNC